MLSQLNSEQKKWVDSTLDSMSIQNCIGHMLMPLHPFNRLSTDFQAVQSTTTDDWLRLLEKIPLGGIFIIRPPSNECREMLTKIQSESNIPVIIADNVELGASPRGLIGFGNDELNEPIYSSFAPNLMGFSAANIPDWTFEACKKIALQRRSYGYHWAFSPVVDLNLNFRNPITNVRSFGDDVEKVISHANSFINGFQYQNSMAATAKHFPGDGIDDRDQHFLTTNNSLSVSKWWKSYGKVWKSVIDEGVNAIMPGHIAFPAYESSLGNPDISMPASLSPNIQIKLLREELGFQGVVISDASSMAGITSRVSPEDRAVSNIEAGVDICLFPETHSDFILIERAVINGRLSEDRIRESAKRILELKARLNLNSSTFALNQTSSNEPSATKTIQQIADKSITLLKPNEIPIPPLSNGEKVLFVNIFAQGPFSNGNLQTAIKTLNSSGVAVDILENPTNSDLMEKIHNYDAIFVNICYIPINGSFGHLGAGFGQFMWTNIHMYRNRVTYTCFGTPYVMHELPFAPNMLLAFGSSESVQIAISKVWLGEISPTGELPVQQPSHINL